MITMYYELVHAIVYRLTGISNTRMTLSELVVYAHVCDVVEDTLAIIAGAILVTIGLTIVVFSKTKRRAVM